MADQSSPVSYVGPMSEDDYLAVVERIQQAMAIEPFRPPLIDVVKLLADWRDLSNQNKRLRTLLRRLYEWDHMASAADGPYWHSEIEKALGGPNGA